MYSLLITYIIKYYCFCLLEFFLVILYLSLATARSIYSTQSICCARSTVQTTKPNFATAKYSITILRRISTASRNTGERRCLRISKIKLSTRNSDRQSRSKYSTEGNHRKVHKSC